MKSTALVVGVVAGLTVMGVFSAGCPERREVIEQVGGAPQAQVELAKERIDRTQQKVDANLSEASKAAE